MRKNALLSTSVFHNQALFIKYFVNVSLKVNLDDAMAMTDDLTDLEWTGHVLGQVWKVFSFVAYFCKIISIK